VRAWAVHAEHLATEAMVSNLFEMEWPPRSGTMREFPEVDRAEWMTVVEAGTRLVAAQVELLDRLAAALGTELPVD
jgi:predicted NUDIX family NTP pyrophosphohydrolase